MKEITQQYSYQVISNNKQWPQLWKTWKQWQKLKERTTYNIDDDDDDDDAIFSEKTYISISRIEISAGWWYIQYTVVLTAHGAEHKLQYCATRALLVSNRWINVQFLTLQRNFSIC